MTSPGGDAVFSDSVAKLYETHMVPLLFEPYATDLAQRAVARSPARVLELAAGTGAVTRALASALPASTAITATDLNESMLEEARERGTSRPVQWRQADAMQLPFDDGAFDLVVCQFGVMFFPDKARAFAEARRVLAPNGTLLFSVWDRLETNEVTATVMSALAEVFASDPPQFMARTPHGYHDLTVVTRDLEAGGFAAPPEVATVTALSRASSARVAAVALCQGSRLRNEIEERGASRLAEATDRAEAALVRQFGRGPLEGKMQAHVITVQKSPSLPAARSP